MENRISKRNVALVEKCVMSTIGIKGLFDAMRIADIRFIFFQNHPRFIRLR